MSRSDTQRESDKAAIEELMKGAPGAWKADPREMLRVGPDFSLAAFDRAGTPGWKGSKDDAREYMEARGAVMAEWQERLYAQAKAGAPDALLVIVQGLDTAGKGGVARHVISMVDPQGIHLKAFKAPTATERAQHFLARVRKELPAPGIIGVFDRSHYEDVLVPGVLARKGELSDTEKTWAVSAAELDERYAEIEQMEAELVAGGTRVLKFCLLVSYEEQGLRLRERLERPDKYWKYSPGDLDVRADWDLYQETYEDMLRRSSSDNAPWYVIPADRKWYSRLSITEIITATLEDMAPAWPDADFDIAAEKAALEATMTPEALKAHR